MRKEDQWNRQGSHEITGDGSCEISAYKLTATDQDKERRNFQGYQEYTPYSLEDIRQGDPSGTTDTDFHTHKMGPGHGGYYTKIYQKHGKAHG